MDRKVKEAYYAIQLERQLSKEQIIEAYMNTIYLGSGANGVAAAALTYFQRMSVNSLWQNALSLRASQRALTNIPQSRN